MESSREVVRDYRTEVSRWYWRLVEFLAGSSERGAVEAVHRELQRRRLVPPGIRLRATMYAEGRKYADPS